MGLAEGQSLPLAMSLSSASPHEVTLVDSLLQQPFIEQNPQRLIGDGAFDSDPMDQQLVEQGIELIAPHREGRVKPPTQDGRPLRRYHHRWKIERLWAWLQNYRRIVVRYERYADNYLGFVHLGCLLILVRTYL